MASVLSVAGVIITSAASSLGPLLPLSLGSSQALGTQEARLPAAMPVVMPTSSRVRNAPRAGSSHRSHQKHLREGTSEPVAVKNVRVWYGGGAHASVNLYNVFYTKAYGGSCERH